MSGPTYVKITADVTDLQAKLALAKSEFSSANSELRSMAQQMRDAGSAANDNMRAGLLQAAQATAQARSEVTSLNRELRDMSGATSSGGLKDFITFGESGIHIKLREMAQAFSTIGVAIAAAFAGREIAEWATGVAEAGAQVLHLSQQTGISVEGISGLSAASKAMGVSVEETANMVERLEKNMAMAQRGTGEQAAAFEALGLKAKDLKGLSIDEVMNRIADAFHNSADGPDKTAIAMTLMGRAGAQMIPVLDQGSEGLANMKKVAEETGTVISGKMADGMEKTVVSIATMKMSFEGVGISLFELFKPAIDAAVKGITEMLIAINNSIRDGGIMNTVIKTVVAGFNGLVLAVATVRIAFEEFYLAAVAGYNAIADAMHGKFAQAQKDIIKGYADMKAAALDYGHTAYNLLTNAGSDLGAKGGESGAGKQKLDASGLNKTTKTAKPQKDFYAEWKQQLDQQLLDQQLFGKEAEAYELQYWQEKLVVAQNGGKNYTGAVRQITGEVYGLESKEHQQAIEDEKRAAEEKKRALDQSYRDFKATIDAQREAAAGNVAAQIALDQQLVDKARALYGQDSVNFQESLRRKLADMKAQIDQQMAPIKKLTDSIGNSFDQMFRGILEGSQTFGQTMQRLALSLVEDFASMGIKSVENWVLSEARKTLVTQQQQTQQVAAVAAGAQAQNTVKAAAEAEGRATDAAAGSISILNDAYKAAAGAYAAVAGIPYVGPILAPIAAGTAYAAVAAFDVMSAAGGMDIPAGVQPLTQLHEKEMVLPANLSERVRNMTDGGQSQRQMPPVHLHINTMDSASFLDNIVGVRREIAKVVAQTFDDNPSLRPQMA